MILKALLAGAVGGLLWLDRFQLLQVLVSRPIVAAPFVGWVVGDAAAGFASGIMFELLWLRRPPVGGHIAPDGGLASMAVTAVAAQVRAETGADLFSMVFLAFLVLFPVAFLGRRVDLALRDRLAGLARSAVACQIMGRDLGAIPYFGLGLFLGFALAFAVLVPVILVAGFVLTELLPVIPPAVIKAMGMGFFLVPLMGVVDFMVGFEERRDILLFAIGFLVAVGGTALVALLVG